MKQQLSLLEPPILGKYLETMADEFDAKVVDMMLAFGIGSNQQYHNKKKLRKEAKSGRVKGEEELNLAIAIHFMHFVRYPERFPGRSRVVNWTRKVQEILEISQMGEGIAAKEWLGLMIGHRRNQIYNYINPDNDSKPSRTTCATLLNLERVLKDPNTARRAIALRQWEKDAEAVWLNRKTKLTDISQTKQRLELIQAPIVRAHFQVMKDQYVAKDLHMFRAFGFSESNQFAASKEPLKHVEPSLAINFMYLKQDRDRFMAPPVSIDDLANALGLSANSDQDKIWLGRMIGRQRQMVYNSIKRDTTPSLYAQSTIAELYSIATEPNAALRKRMLADWQADAEMIWERTTRLAKVEDDEEDED